MVRTKCDGRPAGRGLRLAQKDNLYRCLDKLLAHKAELFSFLRQRWETLFEAGFEVLLYDLTSTYFECDPPGAGKRRLAIAGTNDRIACRWSSP